MKKFVLHLSIISILTLSIILLILSRADGWTDPFYIHFTTPKQQNMILGTSRAAQGLQPRNIEQILNKGFYNYAFTVAHSPFGKVYYESIKRKHSRKKGGLFIVAVDPWSISSWCESPNDLEQFRENKLFLNKIKNVDFNSKMFYLLDNLSGNYIDILSGSYLDFLFKNKPSMFLHKDGWLEINNIKMDSISVANRVSNKIETYRYTNLPKTNYSSIRLDYLVKTIIYLKEYGNVYLVRLPIHKSLMEVEEELMPDFSFKIKEAINVSNGYLDMTPQNELFEYTDGNHLYKESGKKVSTYVGNWILEKEKAQQSTVVKTK